MARAALVVCAIAAATALPVAAAHGATSRSSFVVRGVVVQYIAPSGSVVGSLSIRVLATSARGQALLGELVTVPVARGKAASASGLLPQKSQCTVTLSARSTGAILKGTAVVKAIVASGPADGGSGQPGNVGTPPKVDPDTTSAGNGASTGGSPGHGQGGDHDSGNGNGNNNENGGSGRGSGGSHDDDSGSQAHAGAGKSGAHK